MKLRMHRNSIRLRLTHAEVMALADGLQVTEMLVFSPDVTFTFGVMVDSESRAIVADYTPGEMVVRIPEAVVRAWATDACTGVSAEQPPNGGASALRILIEKDLPCEHKPAAVSDESASAITPSATTAFDDDDE